MAVETRTDARRAALARLIDHAALFPPARMTTPDALAEDAYLRALPHAWLVGRFVVPLTRLAELGDSALPLSVVLDADPDERLDDPRVEAVEVPPGRAADGLADRGSEVYVERPLDELSWLEELAARGLRAKARCGGRATPAVAELAAFVRRCRELALPFKATAGLHHAVRTGGEHGFLNLLAAATFGSEEEALADTDPAAFELTRERFRWHDRSAGPAELVRVRRERFVSFGSCTVREPLDHLQALGALAGS